MNLLRQYIQGLLTEQKPPPPVLDDLTVTVRVSIAGPTKPRLDDILTKIRGLPDVITVRQEGSLRAAPEGRKLANLMIRFERGDGYTIEDLKKDLLTVPGVDLSAIKLINDEPYVKEALRNCVRALLNEAVSSKVPIRLTPHSVQKYFDAYDKIGPSTMIAEFVSSVPLYRIVDAREILKISQGGTISGGKYNVGIERMGGAAYSLDPDELPAWGAAQTSRPAATSGMDKPGTGRMVGETLFIIEVDGGGEEFLAMGATLDGDKITPENPFDRDSKLGQAFDEWRGSQPGSWRRGYTPTPEQRAADDEKRQKAGDVIQGAVDYYNGLSLQLDARACTTGLGCNLRLTKEDIQKVWWFSGFDTPQEFAKAKEEITFAEAVELARQEKTAMGKKPEETQTSSERAWTREGLVREYIRGILLESGIHPKIEAQLEKALKMGLEFRMLNWGGAAGGSASIDISIVDSEGNRVGQLQASYKKSKTGPCNGAAVISGGGVNASHGLGPLLYDLAFEIAEKKGLQGLGPDPREVSSDAASVWDYYLNNRPDIEARQRDFMEDPQTPDPNDDCLGQGDLAKKFGGTEKAYTSSTHIEPKYFDDPAEGYTVPTGYTPEFIEHYFDPKNSLSKTYHKMSSGTPILDYLAKMAKLSPADSKKLDMPQSREQIVKYLEDNPKKWPLKSYGGSNQNRPENKLPLEDVLAKWQGDSTP